MMSKNGFLWDPGVERTRGKHLSVCVAQGKFLNGCANIGSRMDGRRKSTMKIRIENSLLARARVCSDAVDVPLSAWCGLALKALRKGDLKRVVNGENNKNATRKDSTVCTLPGEQNEVDDMRIAIHSAVAHCESKRVETFVSDLVEGRDYIVGGEW